MLLTINAIISGDDLSTMTEQLTKLSWRDGRLTAGKTASTVKRNEQANLRTERGLAVQGACMAAISNHPVLIAAARPKCFSNLLISRTSNGGHYGPHIDNALMKKGDARFRSDLSFTLFLTPPADYEGGELIIHTAGASHAVKGEAGDLVLYPSSSIHEVAPVSKGERIVCVGWLESTIADTAQRELLFDLANLRTSMRKAMPAQSAELLTIDKTIANLLRMWAKP